MAYVVSNEYKQMETIIAVSSAASTAWAAANPRVPAGVFIYETDTKKLRIGDGVNTYSALPVKIDEAFSAAHKDLLDKQGTAGGVVVLDGSGKIPVSLMPSEVAGTIVYVNTFGELAGLGTPQKSGLVVVLDASDDPTVNSGAALYGWNPSLNEGAGGWIKIAEYESLDVDFSVFFNKNTMTLDDIQDGTNFVRMTPAERTKLAGVEANADVTDAENVAAAGAVMTSYKLYLVGANAEAMAAAVSEG